MKILFPTVFYLPNVLGGIELYIQHLAIGLQQMGHEVIVVVPAFNNESLKDYFFNNIKVIRYKAYISENKLQIVGLQPNQSLNEFTKLVEKEKPDIIHFNQLTSSSGMSIHHIKAAKQIGAKVVYTNHLSEFICQRGDLKFLGKYPCDGLVTREKCTACLLQKKGFSNNSIGLISKVDNVFIKIIGSQSYRLQSKLSLPSFGTNWHIAKIKEVINSIHGFVSIADWSYQLVKKNGWGKENCFLIKSGLFNNKTQPRNTFVTLDKKIPPLKVVFIGRITPVKGIDTLINAVKLIDSNKIQLSIYGPKEPGSFLPYYKTCMQLIENCKNISMYDAVENDKVVDLLQQHDVLCLPSKNEMSPLILQEAKAAGIPVIGSNLPAIKEQVEDGVNGLLFGIDQYVELKEKLILLINSSTLLNNLKSKIQQPDNFSVTVQKYHDLYTSLFKQVV